MWKQLTAIGIVVLAVALVVGYSGLQGDRSRPAAPTAVQTPAAPTSQATSSPAPTGSPGGGPSLPLVLPKPPDLGPPVGQPTRIQVPAARVDTGFEYAGLLPNGAMDVPKNPDEVAWYKLGPKPGEKGNAIVAGHVDWGGKVRVFYPLKDLKPGDSVTVTDENGRKYEFDVKWSKWYPWNAPDTDIQEVYQQSDRTELTLITCGGEFDHATRNYLNRLVVRAELR